MVVETTGAWAPEAMTVLRHIAAATSVTTGRGAPDMLQERAEDPNGSDRDCLPTTGWQQVLWQNARCW
eukprot:1827434-Heterocapsa_arctica.AAC.1